MSDDWVENVLLTGAVVFTIITVGILLVSGIHLVCLVTR